MRGLTTAAVAAMVAMTTGLGGCATRPGAIAPVAVSPAVYASLDCPAARAALGEKQALEAELTRRQTGAANRDAAGVALIGLPIGSIFGSNVAGALAQTKGERMALEQHMATRCAGA